MMLVASSLEGLGIGLFYPLIEYIQGGPAFLSHGAGLKAACSLSAVGLRPSVGVFIAAIFGIIICGLCVKLGVFILSSHIYNPFMKDLRKEAFQRILSSHFFVFTAGTSASLAQTLETEIDYVGNACNFAAVIVSSSLSLLVYGTCALLVSWPLTLIVGLIGVLRYLVSGRFVKHIHAVGLENGTVRVQLKSLLTALHQGIDVVKNFGAEALEQERFEALSTALTENAETIDKTKGVNAFAEGLLGEGLLCLVVYVAVSRLLVSGANLLTFLFIVSRIIPKITAINDARVHLAEFVSKTERLPQVLSASGLPTLRWGSRHLEELREDVCFEKVSFQYPGAHSSALEDIDLRIEKGRTFALVGESGSGKSTLTRLLLRLFDPTSGRVAVDGVPLPELDREDWTRMVSVVGQDTFIFDDTISANVKYGIPKASDERFWEALRQARADEFVLSLPNKEKTRLGERGVRLSGGQRQRIAIARAFLRDSPILVLDEATSAMDAVTERQIHDALLELSRGRTVLIIAHRFTTVRDADHIVVLDAGRVAESGTHDELISLSGRYRQFLELQTC